MQVSKTEQITGPHVERRIALLERAERIAQIGSWQWSLDTDELIWSPNLFRIYQLPQQLTGPSIETIRERVHPDDRDHVDLVLQSIRDAGVFIPHDYRIICGDSIRHLRAKTANVGDTSGSSLVGTVEDITERRLAEREIAARYVVSEILHEWENLARSSERLLRELAKTMDYDAGAIWVSVEGELAARGFWPRRSARFGGFEGATMRLRLRPGSGLVGGAWRSGSLTSTADLEHEGDFQRRQAAREAGLQSAVTVPITDGDEVLAVVEFVSRERTIPSARLSRSLAAIGYELGQFLGHRRGELAPPPLTPRELQLLQLAANGSSGRAIAERLVISPSTVKTHFENAYVKLDVSDRAAAVAASFRLGLIE